MPIKCRGEKKTHLLFSDAANCNFRKNRCISRYGSAFTTGFGGFAGSRKLSAKAILHPAKPLPGAAPGKEPPAKIWPAKISLLRAFYRAPGKDFAESKHGPRQRKVTVTAPVSSVPFFAGSCIRDTRQRFLIFFPRFSLPGAYWLGSRQSFFYFLFQ